MTNHRSFESINNDNYSNKSFILLQRVTKRVQLSQTITTDLRQNKAKQLAVYVFNEIAFALECPHLASMIPTRFCIVLFCGMLN